MKNERETRSTPTELPNPIDRLLGATEETLASASGTSRSGRATKEGYSLRALTVCVFVASCAVWAAFAKELSALSTLDDGAGAASGGLYGDEHRSRAGEDCFDGPQIIPYVSVTGAASQWVVVVHTINACSLGIGRAELLPSSGISWIPWCVSARVRRHLR